jgi:large subunit ribosomal protein L25
MVECLASEMPDHLEVDISKLDIHDSVRVKDIQAPAGVRILLPEEEAVIVIAPPVRAEAVAPTVEGALVEEQAEPERIGESEE